MQVCQICGAWTSAGRFCPECEKQIEERVRALASLWLRRKPAWVTGPRRVGSNAAGRATPAQMRPDPTSLHWQPGKWGPNGGLADPQPAGLNSGGRLMWSGRIPEIGELREKAARVGPGKPGWRVYLYENVFWVAKVDLLGREEVIAGVSSDRQAVWLRDLHLNLGEVILEAAGVA